MNTTNTVTKKKYMVGIIIGSVVVIIALLGVLGGTLFPKTTTAEKLDDFGKACHGSKITNAAAYTDAKSAAIAAFYERPHSDKNPWTNFSGGPTANMAKYGEFAEANVVACFDYQPLAGKELARCEDDIKLMSATYKTIFYEAKTGKKIAEGADIVSSDADCPSIFVYDDISRETAREPGREAMTKAIADFVK